MEHKITNNRKWFLKFTILLYFSTVGIILPYFPLLFSHRGLDSSQIGTLLAIGPFVSTLVQFLWGIVSDRLQTVKKLVIFLLIMGGLSSNLIFSSDSFRSLLAAVFIFYAFAWPVIPLLDSLTLATVKETGEGYGSYRLWGSLGFAISALLGGTILKTIGIENVGYLYQSLLCACILMCMLILDTRPSAHRVTLNEAKRILGRKEILVFLLIATLLSTTNKANDAFLGLYIQHLGGSEQAVGWAWTVAPLSEIPIFAFSGYLMTRFHELYLLALASIAFGLRWILFSLVQSPEMLIPVQLLHSLTFGLFFMSAVGYMSRLVPQNLRASGQGLLSTFIGGVAGIFGSYMGGILFSSGPRLLYISLAIVSLCTFWFFYRHYKSTVQKNCG